MNMRVSEIRSTSELEGFIENNNGRKLVIEFKAMWCPGSMMLKTFFEKLASIYKDSELKFASVDVEYIGVHKLNSLRGDLNLGAIPSFYIYENNVLNGSIITSSSDKLESFIKWHSGGYTNDLFMKHETKLTTDPPDEPKIRSLKKNLRRLVLDKSIKRNLEHKTNDLKVSEIDSKVLNDPKIIQTEIRILTALNANNIDKQITTDYFRNALSSNMLTKEQEKFLNRMATKDLENPVIACQENENTSESISEENSEPNEINPIASKYKGQAFSLAMLVKAKQNLLMKKISSENYSDNKTKSLDIRRRSDTLSMKQAQSARSISYSSRRRTSD